MDQSLEGLLDDKNMIVMKLLHYFITEKNYNPIILQGAENEIWLENMDEDYKIVRIVSNYIHNDEQFNFDIFKTRRIMKKIKAKTLSFNINALSIFLDLGENVNLNENIKNIDCINVLDEKDLTKNKFVQRSFPDLGKKLKFSEEGMDLFVKITNDINKHNKSDADQVEEVFSPKYPVVTYSLIALNVILYFIPLLFGAHDYEVYNFGLHYSLVTSGEFYRLITSAFIHGSIFHLLCNCYALYVIGSQLESFLGKTKYLVVYFVSALCGNLMSIVFMRESFSIGASGAIFGLMGSLVYFGYHYRVYLGNIIKSQIIPLICLNLILGFSLTGVDNFAHIGGLIGGFLITIGLGVKYKSTTFEKVNGLIVTLIYMAFLTYMVFFYA